MSAKDVSAALPDNGRVRLPAVFDPLDKAADAVIEASGRDDIWLKFRVLASLADGTGHLGNALSVLHTRLAGAGYPAAVLASVWQARMALSNAAGLCGEAESAVFRVTPLGLEGHSSS